jgi:hypothetical protein
MKRALTALLVASFAAVAWAQPKVAVLDTIIPQNMDPSIIVPTTEKIIERLVVSGRFTVLDRANIESVLKEREFQVSGMVNDSDVVTAGKYLGADFVVVTKVQKVGDTYFISAKMIAIKTGVIANQTSAEGEGKLSMLISLAEQVGEVLSGGSVLAQAAAGGTKDISKPEEKPNANEPPAQKPTVTAVVPPLTQKKAYGLPIFLNIIPGLGVGSFVEGDAWGGVICLVGAGVGWGMLIDSVFVKTNAYEFLGSIAVGSGVLVYSIVEPIVFANKYNAKNGLTSVDVMPTLSPASANGKLVAAPGAIVKLSF